MIQLYEGGVYLVNGTELVPADQNAPAILRSKTGSAPSGATAEKGRIILETSARVLIPGLKEIREWNA